MRSTNPIEHLGRIPPLEPGLGKAGAPAPASDEDAVLRAIARWLDALQQRSGRQLEALYSREAVRYEARTPVRSVGSARIRLAWECLLRRFSERLRAETIDINHYVAGEHAFTHFMLKLTGVSTEFDDAMWLGVTFGFGVEEGHWKIVHEHVSASPYPGPDQEWQVCDHDDRPE